MIDWTKSMQHTYEHYIVDPSTWKDSTRLTTVKSSSIERDSEAETLGSASFDISESVGECYIRTYLIAIQNGVSEKIPLGTHLIQTPSTSFDGKVSSYSLDAYTPLLELKDVQMPIGYYIPKDTNIMDRAYALIRETSRAPVVRTNNATTLNQDFIADISDSYLLFTRDLIANAEYHLDLDEYGRILFAPKQDTASLNPVWTYTDDNSSILYPDISVDRDLYGIPNVVEVLYSGTTKSKPNGKAFLYSKVVNDDPNSPVSTVNRGRQITHRITNPDLLGGIDQERIDRYAKQALRDLSTLEYTISYTHGYCPVRVGDCVMLNYTRAGFNNVKARVISQSIKCEPGCPVTEKAIFTTNLWG